MCGITGLCGNFAPELISRMTAALNHRGPDDCGSWFSEDGKTALGHARLSIIDLSSDGHQPMTNEDGRFWLTFNGEIYNFSELKKLLTEKGHIFKSRTDSEVLLHLYEEYGIEMLKKLNGIFAFAIYDCRLKTTFLARDAVGVKPLYYSQTADGVLFSSELKSFLCYQNLNREIDLGTVNSHLAFMWSPSPDTMFKHVKKIPPGHYCIIRNGRMESLQQWYILPFDGHRHSLSEQQIQRQLAEKIEEAVRRQMVSDVPVGAFLSGGLDSSAITAMMRRIQPASSIKCYSIGFNNENDVEGCPADLPYARKVAHHLNLDLQEITVTPEQLIARISELIWFLDEPQADPAPVNAMFIGEQARKDGIKVLLSGAGGDDIFTGYRRHQAMKLESFWAWLPESVRKFAGNIAGKHTDVRNPWARRVVKVLQNAHQPPDQRLFSYYLWSSEEIRKSLFSASSALQAFQKTTTDSFSRAISEISNETDPINQMLFLDSRFFLPDHNLNYTDKTCMRYGVEARVPLLDTDLIKFAAGIPVNLKQTFTTGKAVFKKAMEPFLPHDVIYRAKTAFGAPLRHWIRNDLREIIAKLLSRKRLEERGIFSYDAVNRLIEDDLAGRTDGSYTIFAVLCCEIWCQLFVDGKKYQEISI